MFEIKGNIWKCYPSDIIVITTNGSVTKHGKAIFGNGVAKQAAERFPGLAEKLGKLLQEKGNHVFEPMEGIVTFPVEETPWSLPDTRLISRSAYELRILADYSGWLKIIVPRPGCGGGGLAWGEVKPLLEPWFDDRFMVIRQP